MSAVRENGPYQRGTVPAPPQLSHGIVLKGLRKRLGLADKPTMRDLSPQVQMGIALARLGKPTYAGTVPFDEVARRRAANRRAKASRKINRRSR